MKLNVDFKSSDTQLKADFGALTQLSDEQKNTYEKSIDELRKRVEQLEKENPELYQKGFTDGKKEEYDLFWDNYQENGARTLYTRGFAGSGWNDLNFKPKYNIVPTEATSMFTISAITDLDTLLKNSGAALNLSKANKTDYMFYLSMVTAVPSLNISNASSVSYMFNKAKKLHTIKCLKVARTQELGDEFFEGCTSLKYLRFDGLVGCNLNLKDCPLDYDSIYHIVFQLDTEIEGERTVTFSKTVVDSLFETEPGANDGSDSTDWLYLAQCRPMWTFKVA